MYCVKCGNKVSGEKSYCTNCGNKLINDKNRKNDLLVSSLIIGILSIIGTITCNIFILPLAIFGFILGIQSTKKLNIGVVLNLVAMILSVFFFFNVFFYGIAMYKENVRETPSVSSRDKYNFSETIGGTWYLDKGNSISNDCYLAFSQNNTFVWIQEDGKKYTGTYKEEYKTAGTNLYYYISLSGVDDNNQKKNFELSIEINNREMTVCDLETNEVQSYKKENIEVY